ncbi:endonuclease VII domain-containing protein [Micromonospora sp. NPDC048839]|uniref:endonuclease VII domain-containing protein n=1 Tax=Micromonospora sp. NPDC048839 TaxID=3155641 RepID=UPI0033CA8F88
MSATGERHRGKPCKDCGGKKGPNQQTELRCYRCRLLARRQRRERAHGYRVMRVYGISAGEYRLLYEYQGKRCAICERATGATKKLAVDHDHAREELEGSRASVRGLLCGPCNEMLGHARDDPKFFLRAVNYLINPPAREVLSLDELPTEA